MKTFAIVAAVFAAIVSVAAAQSPVAASAAGGKLTKEQAQAVFEKFKGLEGQWAGKSTKGWDDRITYKTIAGGSCVMETSFDAHPNETMATMIHMDGERLLLTHYCMAKNQPRLCATEFDEKTNAVTFTFLDATNLPSRDKGHMDKAVFRFDGSDKFSCRWTWYQDGKESWMEEIVHTRVKSDAAAEKPTDAKPAGG